jgi:hypothetical protein
MLQQYEYYHYQTVLIPENNGGIGREISWLLESSNSFREVNTVSFSCKGSFFVIAKGAISAFLSVT